MDKLIADMLARLQDVRSDADKFETMARELQKRAEALEPTSAKLDGVLKAVAEAEAKLATYEAEYRKVEGLYKTLKQSIH